MQRLPMFLSMVHHLTSGIEDTFGPDCVLILETARYVCCTQKVL